jgi:hypothetical protein
MAMAHAFSSVSEQTMTSDEQQHVVIFDNKTQITQDTLLAPALLLRPLLLLGVTCEI